MAVVHQQLAEIAKPLQMASGKKNWHKHIVNIALLSTVAFQLVNLPGALLSRSLLAILIILSGLALCGLVYLFQYLNKKSVASVLLIVVVNMGCILTLLMTPGGLDAANLPIFDVLIVSELLAVSLLPAESVFVVALTNVLFTLVDIMFQPHTAALDHLLTSGMGYAVIVHPLSLQIVVAVITYIWVRRTQQAIAWANHAEEVAELRKREADRKQQLDHDIEQMSQALTRAANGDRYVRVDLSQDNVLWRIGNLFNILMMRLAKASRVEQENQQLRAQVAQLSEAIRTRYP